MATNITTGTILGGGVTTGSVLTASGTTPYPGIVTNGQQYTLSPSWNTMYMSLTATDKYIEIQDANSQPIVTLYSDGAVIWTDSIKIDEAAESFARSLYLGAELKSGIIETSKRKMRDSVFEDLISIAREKGSLTAEDLTYMLAASKIVEKLKT
jgi:hypothetical protein